MSTTKEEIRRWLEDGKKLGASHTLIVCDTFSHEDFPVHCTPGTFERMFEAYNNVNMNRIQEIYKLTEDIEKQLDLPYCWNI